MAESRAILLADLDACRWLTMRALADDAAERGEDELAAGWRWLADQRFWPVDTATQAGPYRWDSWRDKTNRREGRLQTVVLKQLNLTLVNRAQDDPAVLSAYEEARRKHWEEEVRCREEFPSRARMAAEDPTHWERGIRFEVTLGHYWLLLERYYREPFLLRHWTSNNFPLLLEDTARAAGRWLAAGGGKRKRLRGEVKP